MKKISLLKIILLSSFFSGCAAFHAQNCTENAGYEKGMNDAKMGRLMAMGQFAALCSGKDVELAQKGYREGFEAGKNSAGTPQMNLTFKNGKLGLAGAYNCQITYQGQNFTDQASSESQARNNVLTKCRKKIPSCMENSITCSKN
ncbi:MAG: hypothetical protein ACXVCE_12145 [Bacteriovorax sp.]